MVKVFQQLPFEKSSKGGAFGVAGRADTPFFAAEGEQALASTCIALELGEARFRNTAV